MSPTLKNWITTALGALAVGAVTYLSQNAPAADTWAAWKPVLLAALAAGLLAAYHAYQPQSGVSAKGGGGAGGGSASANSNVTPMPETEGPYPSTAARMAYRTNARAAAPVERARLRWTRPLDFVAVGITLAVGALLSIGIVSAGCAAGVPTPQTQAVIVASDNLALCVEGVLVADESKTPPVPATQVVLDEGLGCAVQAAALVTAIGQENTAENQATVVSYAHNAVVSRQAAAKAGH